MGVNSQSVAAMCGEREIELIDSGWSPVKLGPPREREEISISGSLP